MHSRYLDKFQVDLRPMKCFINFLFGTQVQPVAELVELSRRWGTDGREIRLNEAIAKGGTLRRTGSLRHREAKVSSNFPRRFHFNLDFFYLIFCRF